MGALKAFLVSLGLPGIFLGSMIPILELRASIPLGIGIGLDPVWVVILSIIGNTLPVPILILFTRKVFDFMKTHSKTLANIVTKLEMKGEKHRNKIEKYAAFGLLILVAIPLPGTGAWTGSLVATICDIPLKRALPIIFLGVCIAAGIVTALTLGVIAII